MEINVKKKGSAYEFYARSGNLKLGKATITRADNFTFLLDEIVATPPKRGTGTQIMAQIEKVILMEGGCIINTQAEPDAIVFYEKGGFSADPENAQNLKPLGLTWMYKIL